MLDRPTGAVTFLFTDIEGSTIRWERHPDLMPRAFALQEAIIREAVTKNGGYTYKMIGDAFQAAFQTAPAALAAAVAAQCGLAAADWGAIGPIRVRMALHTAVTEERADDYVGPALNRLARVLVAGHGGQVLLTEAACALARPALPPGVELRDLGEHRLKDLARPERVFQVVAPDLPVRFPPLRTLDTQPDAQAPRRGFGELLRRLRKAAWLTQGALAEKAGLSARTISEIERGLGPPPGGGALLALGAALGLTGADRRQFDQAAEAMLAPTPAPPPGPARPHPPLTQNAFVGRRRLVAHVENLLRRESTRLVTLVGGPGIGKTRLALQVADALWNAFRDGVHVIALAAVTEPEQVTPAIAQGLGLRDSPAGALDDAVREFLRDKQALLVVDNFEQVIAAAPALAALIADAPGVRTLVTSRERLRLYGEHDVLVPALTLPDPARMPPVAQLPEFEACALFVERAQAAQRDFALTPANASVVATICARLDGVPLAIELAAARIAHLSPAALLSRLETRLPLLTGGPRDAPQRQQTLRNAIAWSYDLLPPAEQRLFRHLGVFVGGCTLDAAAASLGATGQAAERVIEEIAALVDKSLLRREEQADGEARFRMLETLREYALEQLAASGDIERTREAHAAFFLARADEADRAMLGPSEQVWLDRLEMDHDNFRAALAWALGPPRPANPALGARLALALWRFWFVRGYLSEGRQWMEAALAAPDAISSEQQARAYFRAGALAENQADFSRAEALLGDALRLYRETGDQAGVSNTLMSLAAVAINSGEYARATAWLNESLTLSRRLDHRRGVIGCQNLLSYVGIVQGDYRMARRLLEEAAQAAAEGGIDEYRAIILNNLGEVARSSGDYDAARRLHEESLELKRELGDKVGIASSLNGLGNVAYALGEIDAAEAYYRESLGLFRELGEASATAQLLSNLGRVAATRGADEAALRLLAPSLAAFWKLGDRRQAAIALARLAQVALHEQREAATRRAAQMLGAADGLLAAIQARLEPIAQAEYERMVEAGVAALGPEAWAAEWAEGRALEPELAVRDALSTAH
jgi:predicted ATPase/class 3 adenylate cyclase/transcriptional regulator with XRE-family HTH domain